MDGHREHNGLQSFLEHWGLWLMAIGSFLASQVIMFFTRLTGAPWIWCYRIGLFFAAIGVALLF